MNANTFQPCRNFREVLREIRLASWRDIVVALFIVAAYHVIKGGVRHRCHELHKWIEAQRLVENTRLERLR